MDNTESCQPPQFDNSNIDPCEVDIERQQEEIAVESPNIFALKPGIADDAAVVTTNERENQLLLKCFTKWCT